MIPISRGNPPPELVQLQNEAAKQHLSPARAYNLLCRAFGLKQKVKEQLIREQGGLCAYCMCAIPRNDVEPSIAPTSIEHLMPRKPVNGRDVGQGVDYNNMVVVCHGNRNVHGVRHWGDLTCDAHKENVEFHKVDPRNPETLKSIFYRSDGRIDASDPAVKYDLEETLNLNSPTSPLVGERKRVLGKLVWEISLVPEEKRKQWCRMVLTKYESQTGKKTPYVGVIIWRLRSYLERIARG